MQSQSDDSFKYVWQDEALEYIKIYKAYMHMLFMFFFSNRHKLACTNSTRDFSQLLILTKSVIMKP